jgi:hypothetical protein
MRKNNIIGHVEGKRVLSVRPLKGYIWIDNEKYITRISGICPICDKVTSAHWDLTSAGFEIGNRKIKRCKHFLGCTESEKGDPIEMKFAKSPIGVVMDAELIPDGWIARRHNDKCKCLFRFYTQRRSKYPYPRIILVLPEPACQTGESIRGKKIYHHNVKRTDWTFDRFEIV